MGDMAEHTAAMADDDGFDSPDDDPTPEDGPQAPPVLKADPVRPEAGKNGRYTLPNPETGKSASWQRVTNHTKLIEDTYHLERWTERNVIKGVAMLALTRPGFIEDLARRDVREDKKRLDNIVSRAKDEAETYKMADEGTALHKSAELADYAGGDLNRVPEHHRAKIRLYLDALAAHGITVVPGMIERVTVSTRYGVCGKFDRIYRLPDGSLVIGDLKTGDDLSFSKKGIAAQLDCYQDGVNTHGVWNGMRYDDTIKVRDDIGVIIHLPSTRDEVHVLTTPLADGRAINDGNMAVKAARKVKAELAPFDAAVHGMTGDVADQHWLEALNGAWTYAEMVDVAKRARAFGQWNERLAAQARKLSAELTAAGTRMGS